MMKSLRILKLFTPTTADLEKARQLRACSCPRRYCWWWRSLGFDWKVNIIDGCTFLQTNKPGGWKNSDQPCRRAVPASEYDHFEPREAALIADHLPDRWSQRT